MKIVLISILMLSASSCASAPWKDYQAVSFKKQGWRICSKEIDGEKYHLKGFCYWQKQRKNRRILRDLFRKDHKFCAFSDESCLLKFMQAGKKIK